jgi:CRP-like cAMP-binding protein
MPGIWKCSPRPIPYVIFPTSGLLSIVGRAGNREIELGIAGNEGMTGLALLLGVDRTPYETFTQIAGSGFRLPAAVFADVLKQSPTLRAYLLRYLFAFQVQLSETAIAHGIEKISHRLARWLLMCQDRSYSNEIHISHEFISVMLSVRRAGVSEALRGLVNPGYVTTERGIITIVDRLGLISLAGSTYGTSESEYKRVLGFSPFAAITQVTENCTVLDNV